METIEAPDVGPHSMLNDASTCPLPISESDEEFSSDYSCEDEECERFPDDFPEIISEQSSLEQGQEQRKESAREFQRRKKAEREKFFEMMNSGTAEDRVGITKAKDATEYLKVLDDFEQKASQKRFRRKKTKHNSTATVSRQPSNVSKKSTSDSPTKSPRLPSTIPNESANKRSRSTNENQEPIVIEHFTSEEKEESSHKRKDSAHHVSLRESLKSKLSNAIAKGRRKLERKLQLVLPSQRQLRSSE